MKVLLALFCLSACFAISSFSYSAKSKESVEAKSKYKSYEKEWKEVDALLNKGLPKSALPKIQNILTKAEKDKNHPQIVKALLHLERITYQTEEESLKKIITDLELKTKKYTQPSQSILYSVLGQLYKTYFDNNQYAISQRTQMVADEQDLSDMSTWTAKTLLDTSNALVLKSISHPDLKKISVDDYKAILQQYTSSAVRPTLYDVLMYHCLQHFSNPNALIAEFEQNDTYTAEDYFVSLDAFLSLPIEVNKTSGTLKQLMSVYQIAEKYAKQNKQTEILLELELMRLQLLKYRIPSEKLAEVYLNAISNLEKQFGNKDILLFNKANYYYEFGGGDVRSNPTIQNYYATANELYNALIKQYPKSQYIPQSKNNQASIQTKHIQVLTEEVMLPNVNNKFLLQYRNIDKVYIALYKLDDAKRLTAYHFDEKNALNKLLIKKLNQWEQTLPKKEDFHEHSVDIKLDPLSFGMYALAISDKNSSVIGTNTHNVIYFQISRLAAMHISQSNDQGIVCVDRESGAPLPGVEIGMYQYNYQIRGFNLLRSDKSSAFGFVDLKKGENSVISLRLKDDYVVFPKQYIYNHHNQPASNHVTAFLFTDRSIYRPGHKIYVKGLHYAIDEKYFPKLQQSDALEVQLFDANFQLVQTQTVKTNIHAAFSTEFILPSTASLSGMYTLQCAGVQIPIRVEEYKRPGFEVILDTLSDQLALNQNAPFSGKVQSFNGLALSDVGLVYRIYREEITPYYPCGWRYFPIPVEKVEIANGRLKTDVNGAFKSSFLAKSLVKTIQNPFTQFVFTIEVDATDKNNETQSGSQKLSLSEKPIRTTSDVKQYYQNNNFSVQYQSTNANGNKVPTIFALKIYSLEKPQQYFRKRMLPESDVYLYDSVTYKSYFPLDVYRDENNIFNYPAKELIFDIEVQSTGTFNWVVKNLNLKPGAYKIMLSYKDPSEGEAFDEYFEILSTTENSLIEVLQSQLKAEPKDKVSFSIFTPGILHLYHASASFAAQSKFEWTQVNGVHDHSITIHESDRGGLHWLGLAVKDNRFYQLSKSVEIPWTNKALDINFESFRSKILPNSEETFKVIVKPKSGILKPGEITAWMYDAALDAIYKHDIQASFYPTFYPNVVFQGFGFNMEYPVQNIYFKQNYVTYKALIYPELNLFGLNNYYGAVVMRSEAMEDRASGVPPPVPSQAPMGGKDRIQSKVQPEGARDASSNVVAEPKSFVRTNLNETVFFKPHIAFLQDGRASIQFKMNEALTRWKLKLFAHTDDLQYGLTEQEITSYKPIQIKPYYPRFLRTGDLVTISSTVFNASDKATTIKVTLDLRTLDNAQDVTKIFVQGVNQQQLVLSPNQNAVVQWQLRVPEDFTQSVAMRFIADGSEYKDGEEQIVPVLSNRVLLTESQSIFIPGKSEKQFKFESYLKQFANSNAKTYNYAIELSSHPVWYAIQSLPYIMEFPHECSEQIASRLFANSIAAHIVSKYPRIQKAIKTMGTNPDMQSALLKNQELKSALIEETPWVLDAKSETEQMKRLALFLDLNKLSSDRSQAIQLLKLHQESSGGYAWFPGGREDWYMTQHVVENLARLVHLNIEENTGDIQQIIQKASVFLDKQVNKYYQEILDQVKQKRTKLDDKHLSSIIMHYYYVQSLLNIESDKKIKNYFINQMQTHWLSESLYNQALAALILHRNKDLKTSQLIVQSLRERSIQNAELGMYWKMDAGYYWYQSNIETHALMIEVWRELNAPQAEQNQLSLWLLKNKQTNHWPSTKSTTAAIFAMLESGNTWLEEIQPVAVVSSNTKEKVFTVTSEFHGYAKVSFDQTKANPKWAELTFNNPNTSVAWASVYWQYFQDIDKITSFKDNPLKIDRSYYIQKIVDNKMSLVPISDGMPIKIGDKITVRLVVKTDRPMEYIHLKDLRATGLEPIGQLSGYEWKGSLSYYKSPKDLATHFFIHYLPIGSHVMEYDLRATIPGNFSSGYANLQCFYAPEFSTHSAGNKMQIEDND